MRTRHKSKTRVLDQIIVIEAIVLFLFIALYKFTSKPSEKAAGNLDSYVTVTPAVESVISPSPIITVEPTITPEVNEPLGGEEDILDQPLEEGSNDELITPTPEGELPNAEEPLGQTEAGDLESLSPDEQNLNTNANVPAFANGMSNEFIASLSNTQDGSILETPGRDSMVYYMQTDPRWASKYYGGTDTIEKYGCGPTSLSMVISSLTNTKIDPVQMCAWAKEKDYWFQEQGSKHQLIPEAGAAFGLNVTGVENNADAAGKIRSALSEGKYVITLMGKGSFTKGGHFIVLRGITDDDMVYVADPNSKENTDKTWKLTQIVNEAKSWAGGNGPFWIMSK